MEVDDSGGKQVARDLIVQAVKLASDLASAEAASIEDERALRLAASAALQTANALLSTVAFQCTLVNPPADTQAQLDGTGVVIYRCYHSPAHEWDLNGKPRR
jgi:hypothetical protein